MSKVFSNTPSYLSSIIFGSGDLIELSLGWDYVNEWFEVYPIIHLFDKTGKRVDLISFDKRTSQGMKLSNCEGSRYTIELNMKKLPNYVDSIYLSLSSVKSSKKMNKIKDLYVEIVQGKSTEVWGQKDFESNTNSLILLAFEKKDHPFSSSNKNTWDFNFLSKHIDSDFLRVSSILKKESLFSLPEGVPSFKDKLNSKFISILQKISNVFQS